MKKRLLSVALLLLLAASLVAHVWEFRKIRDFAETFAVQGEIEIKRTALLVLHQEVLQSLAKEVDTLRADEKTQTLELHFEEECK